MAKIVETSYLVWLDAYVNSKDNINIQHKLRSLINHFEIFEDIIECEKYIQSISIKDRIILIISGDSSQQLIPRIHEYQQIYSIYIYCLNKQFYQKWSEQYIKVKGVYNEFDQLIDQIQSHRIRRRQNACFEPLSMSIHSTYVNNEQTTSGLDGRFVHSQLLIDCLLRMPPTSTDKNEFISLCLEEQHENEQELQIINEFKNNYSLENSIWWYTRETFLYRLLNKSLRIQNIDLLFGLRFLIRDIEYQLKKYQYSQSVRLYRGQLISNDELEILKQSKGKLISMNSFFSTTLDREVAFFYLDLSNNNSQNNNLKKILFEIDADPCQNGIKPFANIKSLSYFPEEEEVLMMLGSVFRLNHIHLGQHQVWIINMTLCSDHDHDLKLVFDHMTNQYGSKQTRLLLFGHVLVDMGQFNDAEKYYHRLLKDLPSDDKDLPNCYHALGKVACEKGDYELSLEWLKKSFKIVEKTLEETHPIMGFIHTSIGEVYQRQDENDKALESYEKALQIWTQAYSIDHEYIAWCFNNIAIIYDAQKKYLEALDYHKKALNIKQKILPSQHPCMGNTYLNMGNVYYHLGQYDQALDNYQLSYKIYEASLTSHHPSVANAIKNIGIIYEIKGNYSDALKNYRKASLLRQYNFLLSHPDSIEIEKDIQRILSKIK
jgi:tetratricopeptide (TPR) repeat protein